MRGRITDGETEREWRPPSLHHDITSCLGAHEVTQQKQSFSTLLGLKFTLQSLPWAKMHFGFCSLCIMCVFWELCVCFNSLYLQHGTMVFYCCVVVCLLSSDWWLSFCAACILIGRESRVCWWAVGLWGPVHWDEGATFVGCFTGVPAHSACTVTGQRGQAQLPL